MNPGVFRFGLMATCLCGLWMLGAAAHGREELHGINTTSNSGIKVSVISPFSELPVSGYIPIWVEIENGTTRDHRWILHSQLGSWNNPQTTQTASFPLAVEAGRSRKFEILVPAMVYAESGRHHGNSNLTLRLEGHGVAAQSAYTNYLNREHAVPMATYAMSSSLYLANAAELNTSDGKFWTLASFEPTFLPTDWRGYTGMAAVGMRDSEWQELEGHVRRALLEWVATGGRVVLYATEDSTAALHGIQGRPNASGMVYGLGYIHQLALMDETTLRGPEPAEEFRKQQSLWNQLTGDRDGHLLWQDLPGRVVHAWIYILLLILFTAVVGPFNFFVFSRGSRRFLLLITIPVISLVFTLLLAVLILLQDGIGGEGRRLALWVHQPEENRAVLYQRQVSQTGLMPDARFRVDAAAFFTQDRNLDAGVSERSQQFNHEAGGRLGGAFFRSRTRHSHWAKKVASTRARIEVSGSNGDDGPLLLSTFEYPLDLVFYRDPQQVIWKVVDLQPGRSQSAVLAESQEFEAWWRQQVEPQSTVISGHLKRVTNNGPHFFASASGRAEGLLASHERIDWKNDRVVHVGGVVVRTP